MYATPWHAGGDTAGGDLPGYLRLWRFEQYYRLSADQLPAVLHRENLDPGALEFSRWQPGGRLTGARVWLFRLPSGQITAALSFIGTFGSSRACSPPARAKFERAGWLADGREDIDPRTAGRPAQRFYRITGAGALAARCQLAELSERYRPPAPGRARLAPQSGTT